LDGSIYASAIQQSGQNPPPDEKSLEFPLCDTPTQFKDAGWKIRPLSDFQRDFVERVQPYNTPKNITPDKIIFNINRTLGILNDWARNDRHRNLRVVGSWMSDANPMFILPQGCHFSYIFFSNDCFLEDNNVIAEFKINGFRHGMHIDANPDLAIDVSVNEPPIPCVDKDTLGHRIDMMILYVTMIIDTLEETFNHVL
jgi:hypothetical protein